MERSQTFTCSRSAELPQAAAGVERLDSEHAAAVVPEHHEPPPAGEAVQGGELRPLEMRVIFILDRCVDRKLIK
jgi:hypothetical protein